MLWKNKIYTSEVYGTVRCVGLVNPIELFTVIKYLLNFHQKLGLHVFISTPIRPVKGMVVEISPCHVE